MSYENHSLNVRRVIASAVLCATWLVCAGPAAAEGCPTDLNGNGIVNAEDLALLLGAWGADPGHPADINGDDFVNAADLALLLGSWGPCPVPLFGNPEFAAGNGPESVAIADLDGDGDQDLAVANHFSDNVSILLNRTVP